MALNTKACLAWKSIFFFLRVSEIKFLGKRNHERWQSEQCKMLYKKRADKRVLWPKHNQMWITVGAKPLIIQ